MSNIGKKPIILQESVNVDIDQQKVLVSGPKGTLEFKLPQGVSVELKDRKIIVKKKNDDKELEKYVGLTRSILSNMAHGVNELFVKKLELIGVGYRARVEGDDLILNVGFANPVRIKSGNGIKFQVNENIISVSGIDKELVGNISSKLRSIRPPDAYKGKGIRYNKEIVRKKAGKSAKTASVTK